MEPTGAAPLRPTDLREIGPYRLLGRLGEGGMGTVFLARAPTGRFVAVKVVKAAFANQEGFAARFHAEVENARRVASFCTAQVLDNGNTGDGRPYMVTEYIAGTPLSDQITAYGALDPGPLHGVALGVAAALAAIHVAGLVHRDLKPANVILSLSGPRVIDFGIARALDRETGFTLSGELLGSPGWWAPEQIKGETVTPAVDIFTWGCLIAYAGNGRHPFGRGDPITLASRVLHTQPDLGALPSPLNELVRRATAMEPGQRPTAQELLIALVGGSAPAPAANPPTLVSTDLLAEWEPPRNVVDEPDITATFTTPPPGDTMVDRDPSGKGRAGPIPSRRREGPPSHDPPHEHLAQHQSGAPGSEQVTRRDRPGAAPSPDADAAAQAADSRPPPQYAPAHEQRPDAEVVPVTELGRREELVRRTPTARIPPPVDPVYQRPRGTRWLIAAAAALLAIAITGAVLIMTSGRDTATTGSPTGDARPNDVGRRFPLGLAFDDPVVIVPEAPRCGLTEYGGRTQTQGQLCVLRWVLLNPGGRLWKIGAPAVSLRDDRGGRHEPVGGEPEVPSIAPGDRIDGTLVFDLPSNRTPVELSATMLKDGEQIEVRL